MCEVPVSKRSLRGQHVHPRSLEQPRDSFGAGVVRVLAYLAVMGGLIWLMIMAIGGNR